MKARPFRFDAVSTYCGVHLFASEVTGVKIDSEILECLTAELRSEAEVDANVRLLQAGLAAAGEKAKKILRRRARKPRGLGLR